MTRASAAALAAIVTASCGTPLMKLPAGTGVPALDATAAATEATAVCRAASTLSAEISVSGSVAGHRIPRGRLLVGLATPASARIEAPAPFGSPVFVFVARDDDATLVLERDNRVLEHGRPAAVLEALTGVPLDAASLKTTLTGCAAGPDVSVARQLGDDWMVLPEGTGQVYLHRAARGGPWQLAAAIRRDASGAEWRAEYRDFVDGLARTIRLAAGDAGRFDLHLALSQVDINVPLGADVFRVKVPASAAPISVEELRGNGPLGEVRSDGR